MKEQEEPLAVVLLEDVDSYFRQMVETYQHQLYRWMCRQTGSTQDAEDIVQETFLRAYYALRNYAAQGVSLQRVRPWLYKIAFNLYYNKLRRMRPQMQPLETPEEELLQELEHPDPSPEELAGQQESLREVTEVMATLPEHYRIVLNLYYFEELSYQEIAELLHLPLGTVKSKIHRGLGLVRQGLKELNNVSK